MITLGVNIDHVATIREARKGIEPDPVWAASVAETAGCHCITIHLREDRRHIQDRDLEILKKTVSSKLNLEMALTPKIVKIALDTKPDQITLVPEKREEVTTEGGLNVAGSLTKIKNTLKKFHAAGIETSLFIEPSRKQIKASADAGAKYIELHTGKFALTSGEKQDKELKRLIDAASYAHSLGLRVNAGHGINYLNIAKIVKIPHLEELNIGHSIISKSVFTGLDMAVREMLELIHKYSVLFK